MKKSPFVLLYFDFLMKYAIFAAPLNKKATHIKDDSVAQLVEHIPFKDEVLGSNHS